VEIRIYLDYIKIINYPGPAKWIDMEKFKAGKIIARRYRNRRIGEFLKEIDLSEKKSTGITKILRALKMNGSPLPEFETDIDRNYLIATIKKHPTFETKAGMSELPNERSLKEVLKEVLKESDLKKVMPIIEHLQRYGSISPKEAQEAVRKSPTTAWRYLSLLCDKSVVELKGNTNSVIYILKQK
jgi:ATP-dependent DNA helicase RecG